MEENNSTVAFNTRVKNDDKEEFIQMSKELGIPQHEAFRKMVDIFKKMNDFDVTAPGRKAQGEELQVIFDRLLSIYGDVLTSNENLKDNMIEQHARELGLREKEIREVKDAIKEKDESSKQLSKDFKVAENEVKLMNDRLSELAESENKSTQIIKGKETIERELNEKIASLNEMVAGSRKRENIIEKECEDLGLNITQIITEYKKAISSEKEIKEAQKQLLSKIAEKENIATSQVHDLKDKDIEINGLKKQIEFFNAEIESLRNEHRESIIQLKQEHRDTIDKNKKEYLIQITDLKKEHKEELAESKSILRNECSQRIEDIKRDKDNRITEIEDRIKEMTVRETGIINEKGRTKKVKAEIEKL